MRLARLRPAHGSAALLAAFSVMMVGISKRPIFTGDHITPHGPTKQLRLEMRELKKLNRLNLLPC